MIDLSITSQFSIFGKMFGLIKSTKVFLVALIYLSVITFVAQANATSENGKKIVPILFLLLLDEEKSASPLINPVDTTDISITGQGVVGSLISLSVPDNALPCGNGDEETGAVVVDEMGAWDCDIFDSVGLIEEGTEITAIQKEEGKPESEPTTAVVTAALTCQYTLMTPIQIGADNAVSVMGSWPDDSEESDSLLLDSEGNCLSSTLEFDGDFYASFYTFTVTTESSYRLRLSSATVSPQVFVINTEYEGDADEEVVLELNNLEPGDYIIEATTFFAVDDGEEVEGDYTLTLERKP